MVAIVTGAGQQFLAGQPYADKVVTNFFLQRFPDARNNASVLLGLINKGSPTQISGNYVVHPVRYGRNTGVGNVGRGGVIPEPGQQRAEQYSSRSRKGMARILLDGDVIRHGKTNGGAYMTALQMETEGVLDDVMADRARQVHNDGSGRLAEVSSITAGVGGVVTLKVNSSIEGATNTRAADTLNADGWLHVGMRVSFMSSNGATIAANATPQRGFYIVVISVVGNLVNITLATTPNIAADVDPSAITTPIAANMWMVRAHQVGWTGAVSATTGFPDTSWRNEIVGIGGYMSDVGVLDGQHINLTTNQQAGSEDYSKTTTDTLQGLTVANFLWHQAVVLDNGGAGNRALTERLLQQAISDSERRNNSNVGLILSSFPTYDSYVETLVPDKRYVNTTQLHGGHTALDFNGIPWIKDRMCYQNRAMGLDLSQLEMLEIAGIQALGVEDETTWQRVTAGTSAGDRDIYWRAWVWDDTLMLTGIRERLGFNLTELNA